jgi:hypothetical protein
MAQAMGGGCWIRFFTCHVNPTTGDQHFHIVLQDNSYTAIVAW